MIAALDSSFDRPTLAQARAAYAAGVRVWGGYFGSRGGLGLATRWSRQDFANVQEAGLVAIGFCSGWDDPGWIRDTGRAWGILPCLDVETGIRPDGPWVASWVHVAQAGLYGNLSVHYEPGEPPGRGANFNILADYPGWDPRATWSGHLLTPPGPCGWQWQGSHPEFGLSVDRTWLDDTILSSGPGRGGNTAAPAAGGGDSSMVTITGADGRIHRLIVEDLGQRDVEGNRGGPVAWGAFAGGTGGIDGWSGGDGELPGGGGWVAAGTLAATLWTWPSAPLAGGGTGPRELLIVHGRGLDAALWRKALYTDDFTVEAPWAHAAGPVPAIPGQAPVPGPQGPSGPPGPAMDEAQVRALAADEIQRRLTNG